MAKCGQCTSIDQRVAWVGINLPSDEESSLKMASIWSHHEGLDDPINFTICRNQAQGRDARFVTGTPA